VAGTVLIDGKPLAHGLVRFIPNGARSSQASLDENGKFSLTCFDENDGAVLGEHVVIVDGSEYINPDTRRWHAPKMYADVQTSGLKKNVSEPTDSMVIELTWNGGAPSLEVNESLRAEQAHRRKQKQ
jgi:hypothetical protein